MYMNANMNIQIKLGFAACSLSFSERNTVDARILNGDRLIYSVNEVRTLCRRAVGSAIPLLQIEKRRSDTGVILDSIIETARVDSRG